MTLDPGAHGKGSGSTSPWRWLLVIVPVIVILATAAAAHGIAYPKLVTGIAELAVERWKHRNRAQKRRKKARTAAAASG